MKKLLATLPIIHLSNNNLSSIGHRMYFDHLKLTKVILKKKVKIYFAKEIVEFKWLKGEQ